jgi:hypothetical protein
MSNSSSRRFPVTITQLPVTRCQICQQTVAYRPGTRSEALREHYRRCPATTPVSVTTSDHAPNQTPQQQEHCNPDQPANKLNRIGACPGADSAATIS